MALLPEVHRRHHITGGLPSTGHTAQLPSHFGGIQRRLFWFNICRTPTALAYCPLPMRMSAKSQSQAEWVSPPESRLPLCPSLCQSSNGDSDVEGFDQNCLRQARRQEHYQDRSPRKHGMKGHRSWDNCIMQWHEDEAATISNSDNWWCSGGPSWFKTTWQGHRLTDKSAII